MHPQPVGDEVAFYDDGNYLRVEEAGVVRYINKRGLSMQHDRSSGFYIQSDDYSASFSLDNVSHPPSTSLAQLIEILRLWVSAKVPNLDASKVTTGIFDVDRIPALDASKIATGVLDPARLPGFADAVAALTTLDAGSVTTGVLAPERIPILDARKIGSGVLAPERIPELDASAIRTGVLAVEVIPELDASAIKTGLLAVSLIPGLDASVLTSGTLSSERLPILRRENVPGLDASQITSGTLALDRMPQVALDAAMIVSGVFAEERLPALDAAKVISGVLAADRVPPLDASKIASGLLSADRVPNIDASKVSSGVLSTSRIPALDASKVASGMLSADRIPSLDASKLTTGLVSTERLPPLGSLSGLAAVAQGGTGAPTLPSGKLLVGAGTAPVACPTNLHWDSANSRLGVRTATPAEALHVAGNLLTARCTVSNLVLPRVPQPAATANSITIFCDAADGLVKMATPASSECPVVGPYFRNLASYTYASTPTSVMETTSSSTLVTKLTTTVGNMLAGTYRIAVVYQGFTVLAPRSIRVTAFMDTPAVLTFHDGQTQLTPGFNHVTYDFCNAALSAGDHVFTVQYASPSSGQVGLSKAALEIFRIS
jgi:hypothetical protein